MKPEFYIRYRLPGDRIQDELMGEACVTYNEEESLTQQQFREDCDLNVLAVRFGLTGAPLPPAPIDPSAYGDFTNVPDLRTALDLVNDATNRFMELPSGLRTRFHNRPGELWEFVNNPENADEAVRLGLLRRVEPLQTETPVTPPETGEPGHMTS